MEIDWSVVIGEIMTQILRVLIPLFTAMVIKWAVELYHRIKSEQPDWTPVLEYAAELAVLAAEQLFGDGHGKEKKQYAIQTIQNILAEHGLKLDLTVIEDAIEAEVYKWLHHDEQASGGTVQVGAPHPIGEGSGIYVEPVKFDGTEDDLKELIMDSLKRKSSAEVIE